MTASVSLRVEYVIDSQTLLVSKRLDRDLPVLAVNGNVVCTTT